jgi:hypothetical protein
VRINPKQGKLKHLLSLFLARLQQGLKVYVLKEQIYILFMSTTIVGLF